jgi:hypothetical protein
MQKDNCPPVRRPDWRSVHIGKAQILALERYWHETDGIRVSETFQPNAHRLGSDRLRGERDEQGHGDEQTMGECVAQQHGEPSTAGNFIIPGSLLFE